MVMLVQSDIPPVEGHLIRQKDATLYIDNVNYGKGCLVINEKNIIWTNDQNKGVILNYLDLGAHGISRDKSRISDECLCLFYNKKISGLSDIPLLMSNPSPDLQNLAINPTTSNLSDDNTSEVSDDESTNIFLVPKDKGTLDSLYHSIKEFQKLNPDPDDDSYDDDEFGLEDGLGDEEDGEFWQPSEGSASFNLSNRRQNFGNSITSGSGIEVLDNQNDTNFSNQNDPSQVWQVPVFDDHGQLVYDGNHQDDDWVPPSATSSRRPPDNFDQDDMND